MGFQYCGGVGAVVVNEPSEGRKSSSVGFNLVSRK